MRNSRGFIHLAIIAIWMGSAALVVTVQRCWHHHLLVQHRRANPALIKRGKPVLVPSIPF